MTQHSKEPIYGLKLRWRAVTYFVLGNYGDCQNADFFDVVYDYFLCTPWTNPHETKTVTKFNVFSVSTHEPKSNY